MVIHYLIMKNHDSPLIIESMMGLENDGNIAATN